MKKFFTLLVFGFFALSYSTQAAQLNIITPSEQIEKDTQFEVTFIVDSEGEPINTVSGSILFNSENLALASIRENDSFISFWLQRPESFPLSSNTGAINFSGTIPGGFSGTGKIFSAVFLALRPSESQLAPKDILVLRHDGLGTIIETNYKNQSIFIADKSLGSDPKVLANELKDNTAPLNLEIKIIKNHDLYENQWTAIFYTVDPDSGIDHYEVQETSNENYTADGWVRAESPYLLKDQSRKSWVHIKAVNRVGLETINSIPPESPTKNQGVTITTKSVTITLIVLLSLSILFYMYKRMVSKRNKNDTKNNASTL